MKRNGNSEDRRDTIRVTTSEKRGPSKIMSPGRAMSGRREEDREGRVTSEDWADQEFRYGTAGCVHEMQKWGGESD